MSPDSHPVGQGLGFETRFEMDYKLQFRALNDMSMLLVDL